MKIEIENVFDAACTSEVLKILKTSWELIAKTL
jgi:hypothetical protein